MLRLQANNTEKNNDKTKGPPLCIETDITRKCRCRPNRPPSFYDLFLATCVKQTSEYKSVLQKRNEGVEDAYKGVGRDRKERQ